MLCPSLNLALLITLPAPAAVIWLELGSAGTPTQNADGATLTHVETADGDKIITKIWNTIHVVPAK